MNTGGVEACCHRLGALRVRGVCRVRLGLPKRILGIPGAQRADHVVDADPAAEGGVPSMPAAFARPSDALGDGVEDDEGMGESKAQMT